MTHLVRAVSFLDDTVVIEYTGPEDVRSNGLILQHALSIPATEEYADRLDELVAAVQGLLGSALEDSATYPSAASVIDDDSPAPYDNPADGGLDPALTSGDAHEV